MDAIFTESEMSTHCYEAGSRTTKPGLDVTKVQLLEGTVKC